MYEDYDRRFLLEGHSTALDELVECLPAVLKYLSQLARRQPKVTSFGHGGADFVFSSTGAIWCWERNSLEFFRGMVD